MQLGRVAKFPPCTALWALDTLSTTSAGHVEKMVFGNEPTHGAPAKVLWPGGHTLA
jgi:hypothetical protein